MRTLTLRYVPTIEDLNDAYPLARSLADKGIHVSIANNDEMLTEMTMPEYRTPAIYDLGNGQFRFEVNCNQKLNVHFALITRSSKEYKRIGNDYQNGDAGTLGKPASGQLRGKFLGYIVNPNEVANNK